MSKHAQSYELILAGQLGHLTETQQSAFSAFKESLVDKNLYRTPTETQPGSHDEATLLCVSLIQPSSTSLSRLISLWFWSILIRTIIVASYAHVTSIQRRPISSLSTLKNGARR